MNEQLRKTFADARKLGVSDAKSEMLISDFLKVMTNEIKTKKEAINRLQGEIGSMEKMFGLWNNLLTSHIRLEQKAADDYDRANPAETVEKVPRKRRTKAEMKNQNG